MYLLLSPAKNLNEQDPAPLPATGEPALLSASQKIAKALKTLDAPDIQALMKVSAKIATLNVARNLAWQVPFGDAGKPAVYLFDGDAYKGLDAYELHADEMAYLDKRLGIMSGLYGLLKARDAILPYRLEMGTRLTVGKHKNLYDFWGSSITALLNTRLEEAKSDVLVNLASDEYFKVIESNKVNATIITPKFLDLKNGEYKIISFYAKRARGLMTRFCAVNQITCVDELKTFDMENYYFAKEQSTDTEWVFLRDAPF